MIWDWGFWILRMPAGTLLQCSAGGFLSDRALKVPPGYCPDSPLWRSYRLDTPHSWQLCPQLIASKSFPGFSECATFSSYCVFNAHVPLYFVQASIPLNREILGVAAISLLHIDPRTVWHLTWFMVICNLHERRKRAKEEEKKIKKKEEKEKGGGRKGGRGKDSFGQIAFQLSL